MDLLPVGCFQVPLQLAFLQPHTRSAGASRGGSLRQDGLEEEHLASDQTVRPSAFGQFVLVDSAGGVAEEGRLEFSCRGKEASR